MRLRPFGPSGSMDYGQVGAAPLIREPGMPMGDRVIAQSKSTSPGHNTQRAIYASYGPVPNCWAVWCVWWEAGCGALLPSSLLPAFGLRPSRLLRSAILNPLRSLARAAALGVLGAHAGGDLRAVGLGQRH